MEVLLLRALHRMTEQESSWVVALAYDGLILLATQVVFFAFGWVFFVNKLFRDYEVKRIGVQVLFAATFAVSCTLFELIIFEILDVLDKRCSQSSFQH